MKEELIRRNLYNWELHEGKLETLYLTGSMEKTEYNTADILSVGVYDEFVLFFTENAIYECKYSDCKQITKALNHYPMILMRVELALERKYVNEQKELYERLISYMSDKTREDMLKNDQEYCRLEKNRARLEELYRHMDQYSEAMNLVQEYITAVQETDMRFADVSYMAGVKDTILLLTSLGLIKKGYKK